MTVPYIMDGSSLYGLLKSFRALPIQLIFDMDTGQGANEITDGQQLEFHMAVS